MAEAARARQASDKKRAAAAAVPSEPREGDIRFIGTCDVCNQPISFTYNPADGIIDIKITNDGKVATWIRHPTGPKPECDLYSSEVTEQ